MRDTERRLALQYATASALATATSVGEAAAGVLAAVAEGLAWDTGAIWVVDEAAGVIRCADMWHAPQVVAPAFEAATRAAAFAPGVGLPGRVWREGRPLVVADVGSAANFPRAAVAREAGLTSGLSFPIKSGDAVLGTIELFARGAREVDEDLLQMLAAIGSQIGQFLDRQRALDRVHRSEERLRAIFESALDGVVTADQRSVILSWNAQAERTFGWKREEVVGRTLQETIIPPRYRDAHLRGMRHFIASGEGPVLGQRIEIEGIDREGREFPIELTIEPHREAAGYVFSAFVRDISDRRRAAAQQEFLANASRTLAATLDQDDILARVSEIAVPFVGDYCSITLRDAGGAIRRVAATHTDVGNYAELQARLRHFPLSTARDHPIQEVLERGAPVVFAHVDEAALLRIARSSEHLALLREYSLTSWMCVPLRARERVIGAMTVAATVSKRHFNDADVALAADLADRAGMAVDNARLYREAREAVRTRDEFLSGAAHDLKTPLTTIRGMAQLLVRRARRSNEPGVRETIPHLEQIDTMTTKLAAAIDELFDIAALQIGRAIPLHREPGDLVAIVRSAIGALPDAHRERVAVETEVDGVPGDWDAARLERAVQNLLGNAIKYSGDGSPVTVSVTADGGMAQVAVRDRGIGIPQEELGRVFERFARGSNVGERAGTGVGLAASRQLVEMHGGTIEVESALGEGSTFTLRLPLAQPVE